MMKRSPVGNPNFQREPLGGTCIVIPTYNERENITFLIPEIQRILGEHGIDATILIVDDNSPDGTGKLAKKFSNEYGNVHVLQRPAKQGLGSAYKEGFNYAISKLGCDVVIQMDADTSHNPEYIPSLLSKIHEGYEVVVGSRNISGGSVIGWSLRRRLVSRMANRMAVWLCGLGVHDATNGFRAYKTSALKRVNLPKVGSRGYSFQVEILFWTQRARLKTAETPTIFVDRRRGKSKLTFGEIIGFVATCLTLLLERFKRNHSYPVNSPRRSGENGKPLSQIPPA